MPSVVKDPVEGSGDMVLAVLRTFLGNAGVGVPSCRLGSRAELRLGTLSLSTEKVRGPGGREGSRTWQSSGQPGWSQKGAVGPGCEQVHGPEILGMPERSWGGDPG